MSSLPNCPRILVVEDFDLTSRFLSTTLKYCKSAFCYCAASGEEAITIMDEYGPFDLVLTDIYMPGMGGLEFIRRLRKKETDMGWKKQIIIAMSADAENSSLSLQAGSSVFIGKYEEPMHRIFEILDGIRLVENVAKQHAAVDVDEVDVSSLRTDDGATAQSADR
jgi:CheY-like chemotaxis protein